MALSISSAYVNVRRKTSAERRVKAPSAIPSAREPHQPEVTSRAAAGPRPHPVEAEVSEAEGGPDVEVVDPAVGDEAHYGAQHQDAERDTKEGETQSVHRLVEVREPAGALSRRHCR